MTLYDIRAAYEATRPDVLDDIRTVAPIFLAAVECALGLDSAAHDSNIVRAELVRMAEADPRVNEVLKHWPGPLTVDSALANLRVIADASFCVRCGHYGPPVHMPQGAVYCAQCNYGVTDPCNTPLYLAVELMAAALGRPAALDLPAATPAE